MKPIVVKSPTRVDLAGGTLDLWPLFTFVGDCKTINIAISIWTEAQITPHKKKEIQIVSDDIGLNVTFPNLQAVLSSDDPKLKLYQLVLGYLKPKKGFILKTRSESPVGGGLGGSSSLMISILKSLSKLEGRKWKNVHQLVHVAHNLEAGILSTPTGTQDYYPAASGGLNILTYSSDGIDQKVKKLKGSQIEKSFLLVYTGKTHHSGLNNFEVLKSAVAKDKVVLAALGELQKVSEEMVAALTKNQYDALPQLFQREYKARVQLTPAFTSPEIEKLKDISMSAGAAAIKICGAGGGGCVLIWCPENKKKVAQECQKAGFQVMNAVPVDPL